MRDTQGIYSFDKIMCLTLSMEKKNGMCKQSHSMGNNICEATTFPARGGVGSPSVTNFLNTWQLALTQPNQSRLWRS